MGFGTNSFIADCLRGALSPSGLLQYWLRHTDPDHPWGWRWEMLMLRVLTLTRLSGRPGIQSGLSQLHKQLLGPVSVLAKYLAPQARPDSPPLKLWVCAIIWERLWYFRMLAPSWENVEMIIDRTFLQFWRVSKPRLGLSQVWSGPSHHWHHEGCPSIENNTPRLSSPG